MLTAQEVTETIEQLADEYPDDGGMEVCLKDLGQDYDTVRKGFLGSCIEGSPVSERSIEPVLAGFIIGFYLGKTIQHKEFSLN